MKKNVAVIVAVSGIQGSFSHEAAIQYLAKNDCKADLLYSVDMQGVLAALEAEKADLGIFPVFNSTAGVVTMAMEAMGKYAFEFLGWFWLDIKQCLMAKPGIVPQEIMMVTSHPQALLQCQNYLKNNYPQARIVEWEDTAKAAEDLHKGVLKETAAVIAPKRSAELYGLEILGEGIQDLQDNRTAFIVVRKPVNVENPVDLEYLQGELSTLRQNINQYDIKIIELLAKRMETAKEIGQIKKKKSLQITDPAREQELFALYKEKSAKFGLDEEMIEKVFKVIIEESKRIQDFK